MRKVKFFAMSEYVDAAIKKAEYERDEQGVIVAQVPDADGFYAQGDNFEQARQNLREVIEGNVILALQLGWTIPGGRHPKMIHIAKRQIVPVPMHRGKDVGIGLIRTILRQVGITPEVE